MALPTYEGDTKPQVTFSKSDGTVTGRWMGAFQGAKAIPMRGRNTKQATANVQNKMLEFGKGSRGVVQVFWKEGGGHVFNVENTGGKIIARDAQTGKAVNLERYLSYAKPGSVNLIRTDNLKISNRSKDFVTQRK